MEYERSVPVGGVMSILWVRMQQRETTSLSIVHLVLEVVGGDHAKRDYVHALLRARSKISWATFAFHI